MKPRQRFLNACRRESSDCTPVWFMRQAGRYLPAYREIRRDHEVLEAAKTPAISEKITLLPVKELGVDAAVMFADIMLPLEGMGVNFRIEEDVGPIIADPIRNVADVEKLREFQAAKHVPYVLEAIKRVKENLDRTGHALIGFSGAPFTIASYLIEGRPSRDFAKTKRLMMEDRDAWSLLLSKLVDMISKYLSAQIDAGADVVQLFDSWIGALSVVDYEDYIAPFVRRLFDTLGHDYPDTPKIHFGTGNGHLLKSMKRSGGDVFSIDWRISISNAREILQLPIQGNLEPAVLLASRKEFLTKRTQLVLDDNGGSSEYIFNLGHGVLRDTPVENARFVVEYVHENTKT